MNAQTLEKLLTDNLRVRDLERAPGRLAFLHKGQAVEVEVEESIYRGFSINIYDGVNNTSEFRVEFGTFNWDAIAGMIVRLAHRRAADSPIAPRTAASRPYQHHYAMS